jgi:hypothetical protein
MELHVAEDSYHTLGCNEATCSFHFPSFPVNGLMDDVFAQNYNYVGYFR